jgi:hypothetical protein
MNLYWMILLHLLYDFHWQGQFIGEYKGKYPFIMFIHSLTYGMIVGLPYIIVKQDVWSVFLIAVLVVSHYFIDTLKNKWIGITGEDMWLVYIDQFLHLVVLVSVYLVINGMS